MRLLLASAAAFAALALALPAFAQTAAPVPATPAAKPKPGTVAYCNTLKSTSSKTTCLKRVHTQVAAKSGSAPKSKSKARKLEAPKPAETSGQLTAPVATPTTPPSQTVAVPPLPQKTI